MPLSAAGVLYVGDVDQPISLYTMSPSKQHDPAAIWTYLAPLFEYMHVNHPNLEIIHFFSDGPTSQYRQKVNFFLFCTKVFDMGYHAGSWNFWEASHGKGAPDGIGGAIKRKADKLISLGHDIPDAAHLYRALMQEETSIKIFYVEADDVEEAAVPENVPAVPGPMKLHQVVTLVRGTIKYRDVSCCCNNPEPLNCTCYGVKEFTFPTRAQPIVTDPLVPPVLPAADVQLITQVPQTSTVKPASPKQLSLHSDLVPVE